MRRDDFDREQSTPYLIHRVGLGIAEAFRRELVGRGLTTKTWRILTFEEARAAAAVSPAAGGAGTARDPAGTR